jgi:hypothetical protein
MKKALGLCFILCFISISLFADTIVLKSGKRIEGKISERTENYIKIDISGTTLTYFIDEIATINEGSVMREAEPTDSVPRASESQTAAPSVRAYRPDTKVSGALGSNAQSSGGDVSGSSGQNQESLPQRKNYSSAGQTDTQNRIGLDSPWYDMLSMFNVADASMVAALGAFAFVFFIFCIFFYVYGSICFYLISKKSGRGVPLLAWIPIANLFLMLKIADISYWWLFALLICLVPFIGGLLVSVGFVYVWYRIAEARGKPGWLGLLTIIPLANLVVMGYLAFSE